MKIGTEPKFYIDQDGNYIGSFSGVKIYGPDGEIEKEILPEPPIGSIEVPFAPSHGTQKWLGNKWSDL